jgi:hypothetical protein
MASQTGVDRVRVYGLYPLEMLAIPEMIDLTVRNGGW